MLKIYRHFQ
ncbi:rCG39049 [Rattus norvegicus]|uniref:RCG39049 n=1 Tax=Rattus norvegicus TaxID=10116 RepID=A6JXY1_RAT|nr:rCG39049 [Rattus norvegicus]